MFKTATLEIATICSMDVTEQEARERFGAWLRRSREVAGYSLREIAEMVDLSYQSILYYENGERFPDLTTQSRLAAIFNVPPWYPIYIALTPVAKVLPPSDITVMDEGGELLYDLIVGMPKQDRDKLLAQVRAVSSVNQRRSQRGASEEAGPE